MFIRILLPLFAVIALAASIVNRRVHQNVLRGILSVVGPLLVLAAVFVMRDMGVRSDFLLYPGVVLMVVVAI